MYKIIKIIVSKGTTVVTRDEVLTVNCTPTELIEQIIPVLKKLSVADNLMYKLTKSNYRARFSIEPINSGGIADAVSTIKTRVKNSVNDYNSYVSLINATTRRANKGIRDINEGTIDVIADYNLNTKDIDIKYYNNSANVIIVKEDGWSLGS